MNVDPGGNYAPVNGLEMYCEVHGSGEPLILLHGGKADAGWDGSRMPNDRLAILSATTRYDIFSKPVLASPVTPFLDAPMSEAGSG